MLVVEGRAPSEINNNQCNKFRVKEGVHSGFITESLMSKVFKLNQDASANPSNTNNLNTPATTTATTTAFYNNSNHSCINNNLQVRHFFLRFLIIFFKLKIS